jgi:hypothetical protein
MSAVAQDNRGWPDAIADNAAEIRSAARLIDRIRPCSSKVTIASLAASSMIS